MTNTVPLKKQNKRAQKEYHSKKRGSWYGISPVTRSVPNGELMIESKLREKIDELMENESSDTHLGSNVYYNKR